MRIDYLVCAVPRHLPALALARKPCHPVSRINEHPAVSEIICADFDNKAAQELSQILEKAKALQLDASDLNRVIAAADGCDLIVNGLPLEFNLTVMEAALAVNASYIDMAGPMESIGFVESYKLVFSKWHEKFKTRGGDRNCRVRIIFRSG